MITINFDTDANGNNLNFPPGFIETTALTDLYSSIGVNFSGNGRIIDGGAILDEEGNFGVPALSGSSFLAFNRDATLSNGGISTDPEIITFDSPIDSFSIFASGGFEATTFQLEAFDNVGNLIGSNQVDTEIGVYEELTFISETKNINQVVLTEIGGDITFVYDDLSFNFLSTTILGTENDDILNGSTENDSIFGLAGNDTIRGGIGDDTLLGEEGDDVLQGGSGNDLLEGSIGDDTIGGGNGKDRLFGGEGKDILSGGRENDILCGGFGNDFLNGNNGDDTISGGDGFDVIFGGAGNDTIEGNNGIDSLYGNAGADTFILDSGNDPIFDFEDGKDRIAFGNGASFFDATIENSSFGVGSTISVFGQTVGTLVNVDASLITEEDFVS